MSAHGKCFQLVLRSASKNAGGTNSNCDIYVPHVFAGYDQFIAECVEITYCGLDSDVASSGVFEFQTSLNSAYQSDSRNGTAASTGRLGSIQTEAGGCVSRTLPPRFIIGNPSNKTISVRVRHGEDGITAATLYAGGEIRAWTIVLNLYPYFPPKMPLSGSPV